MKNKKKPVISIVVTCYKGGDYLPKCLESLCGQTLKNIEIVCVNDASPDNTADILKEWSEKDDRIVVLTNKENIGVSASRNKGISESQSDYIMFCDADDFYEPTMCAEMLDAIQNNNVDLAACGTNIVYHAHEEMKLSDINYYSIKYSGQTKITDDIILSTDLSPWNKIFKKSIITNNKIAFPEGLYYEDAYFCSAYLCCSKRIYFIDKQLHNYVRHESSTMSNTWSENKQKDNAIDHLHISFKLYDFLISNNLLEKYNTLFWRLFIVFGYFAIENSKTNKRRNLVRKEAANFTKIHAKELSDAQQSVRDEVNNMVRRSILPSTARMKHAILRFMPTYRLQIDNIERLRSLNNSMQENNTKV